MKSAIGILTYRRPDALRHLLDELAVHCSGYPVAVFDDMSGDATEGLMQQDAVYDTELMARYSRREDVDIFTGVINLGVAGNSNRALRWMMRNNIDQLCLCNDDLGVTADFVKIYKEAHALTGINLFCYCGERDETHDWSLVPLRYGDELIMVRVLKRLTGIAMSITRRLVNEIGYFDVSFGQFGSEHCDYAYRAAAAGINVAGGEDITGIDVDHCALYYQQVETSMTGSRRAQADTVSSAVQQFASLTYRWGNHYRPFKLLHSAVGGHSGAGIKDTTCINAAVVSLDPRVAR
jgi:hypothetical protein